jgi:hypothetical protein
LVLPTSGLGDRVNDDDDDIVQEIVTGEDEENDGVGLEDSDEEGDIEGDAD